MVWIQFLISSLIIVFAATKLAEYGDIISVRTGLGGMFIGVILMAGATSLPEVLTTVNSIQAGIPDLAAGNIFGSNMFNMFLLGVIDLLNRRERILRQVIRRHTLSGSIAAMLIAATAFFIVADIDVQIGWVGLDSLVILAMYLVGIHLLRTDSLSASGAESAPPEIDADMPPLSHALIGFAAASLLLVIVMPYLVSSSSEIAEITGLGTGFVGTALVGIVTSLPELVTTIAAVRLGVYDLALGNLFGSNMFNIFTAGLADLFMTDGRFLSVISPGFLLVCLLGLIMTMMGVIGNQAKIEKRFFFIEIDAVLLILVYIGGLFLIYARGLN
ncbi:MAG: sodium:calcium antiporter [Chloroflexi bacterium]|nr:sodium:calcium antiporter [Chloroflexota bacterium]